MGDIHVGADASLARKQASSWAEQVVCRDPHLIPDRLFRGVFSFVPLGLFGRGHPISHDLRRGLYSFAASRLGVSRTFWCQFALGSRISGGFTWDSLPLCPPFREVRERMKSEGEVAREMEAEWEEKSPLLAQNAREKWGPRLWCRIPALNHRAIVGCRCGTWCLFRLFPVLLVDHSKFLSTASIVTTNHRSCNPKAATMRHSSGEPAWGGRPFTTTVFAT